MSAQHTSVQLDRLDNVRSHQHSPARDELTNATEELEADEEQEQEIDADAHDSLNIRVIRKLDFILLPFLALLFLFNSLDRSNVGNAETADFTKDIGLQPEDLNIAIEIFFAFFVTLQPIGAALGRKYGMSHWVIPCMGIWGACTTLHIFITSKWQLYLLRAVIGMLEAGFYPTTVAYLSLFYTRYEFARRLGLFYGQYCIAGAFGGTLSYFVFSAFPRSEESSRSGWKPWQILFGVEGLTTIALAVIGYFWLPRNARTAWFLKTDERRWAESRIMVDSGALVSLSANNRHRGDPEELGDPDAEQGPEESHGLLLRQSSSTVSRRDNSILTDDRGLSVEDIVDAALDWKLWFLLFCNILSSIPVTAFSLFLPLVLKPLTSSAAYANLLTAPPYLIGGAVLFAFSYWSDTTRQRIAPILWSLGLLILGLTGVVLLPQAVPTLRYMFLCVLLSGTFVASPLTIAWFTSNLPSPGKRSIVLGINGWGNLAGVFSSMIFQPRYAPSYSVPFFITLALVSLSFLGYALFRHLIIAENRRRKSLLEQWTESQIHAEASYGKGPLGSSRITLWIAAAIRRIKVSRISQIQDKIKDNRRGDERITFEYGL